ncbi:hypothetical protein HerbRD11066_17520 [Herbidospora sp. RD11066]
MTVAPAAVSQQKYLETGDLAHLEAAIIHSRADLAPHDVETPTAAIHLSRLSNALRMRYQRLGHDRDLDEAVETGRLCVRHTPADHHFRAQRLSNLGFALRLRYERSGRPTDIEQAVSIGEQAVDAAGDDDPNLPMMVSNLAVALRVRHEVSLDPDDLARAIKAGTYCLRATPPDAYERRGMLNNLGLAFFEMFESTRDPADLTKGEALLRLAVDVTPHDDPDWPTYTLNLSVAMRTVATESNSAVAADQAVELAEQALQFLPVGHPERAFALSELGRAHRTRAVGSGDPAERRLAVSYRREAAGDPIASPLTRALAATAWGEWSHADGDLLEAVAGFSAAIDMLGLVAWHGLDIVAQQRHLSRWRKLAPVATATCLDAREHTRAVELLERGRTVLWNQLLDRRADVDRLRAADSDLADGLEYIRAELDADRYREALAGRSQET